MDFAAAWNPHWTGGAFLVSRYLCIGDSERMRGLMLLLVSPWATYEVRFADTTPAPSRGFGTDSWLVWRPPRSLCRSAVALVAAFPRLLLCQQGRFPFVDFVIRLGVARRPVGSGCVWSSVRDCAVAEASLRRLSYLVNN